MSPEKQRIAIAEACGMTWCRIGTDEQPYRMLCWWNPAYAQADLSEPICNPEYMWEHGGVPDYLNDLDAMHEAEKALTVAQRVTYAHKIGVVLSGGSVGRAIPNWWFIHEATAAQRAEAFLRTLGKWGESA